MPFLHISACEGYTLLAIISHEIVLEEGHHEVLDAEIVWSRGEAERWFRKLLINKPWEGEYDSENGTLSSISSARSDGDGLRPSRLLS